MMHLSPEIEKQLAVTPTGKLAELEFLKKDALVKSRAAYIISKRANHLRVRTATATSWGDARARINTISLGVIVTALAYDEFHAAAGAFLLSDEAAFITGTDLLVDGGVIAAIECR